MRRSSVVPRSTTTQKGVRPYGQPMRAGNPSLADAVGDVLAQLRGEHRRVLGDRLVGYYLFGSVVCGWFEAGVSDVDTLAVLASNPTDLEIATLAQMHDEFICPRPEWADRIEVTYLAADALRTFRQAPASAARISPGEPFHAIEVDHRWLIDWYQVRERGVVLDGPPTTTANPLITKQELVEAVRARMRSWPEWFDDCPRNIRSCAYTIITACRGPCLCRTGEHVSKRHAAAWGAHQLPAHAQLISDALTQHYPRLDLRTPIDDGALRHDARAFVGYVAKLV